MLFPVIVFRFYFTNGSHVPYYITNKLTLYVMMGKQWTAATRGYWYKNGKHLHKNGVQVLWYSRNPYLTFVSVIYIKSG